DIRQRDEAHGKEAPGPRPAVVGDVAVVGSHAGDRQLGVEDGLEAERHRAVEDLRVDPLAIHVLETDAVEDAADGGLGMDGGEGALAGTFRLREDALELRPARARVQVADDETRLSVAVGARGQAPAVRGVQVVEEHQRVLHLVRIGIDHEEAVVRAGDCSSRSGRRRRAARCEGTMNAKDGARERLAASESDLLALSRRIHARPELAFEEEHAAGWLADALDSAGFRVERGVCDVPTAFVARAGSGPLHIAICAEYDALPDIGHACGHNVIAALAVGAGLAAARVADDVGVTVGVAGTPAEESGGGKILLLERGAFAGVHAAMMAHPAPLDVLEPPTLAFAEFEAHFHGKASHASAAPELGVN